MDNNILFKFVKIMCRKVGKDRWKINYSVRKIIVILFVNVVVLFIYLSFVNIICGYKNVLFYIL